MGVLLGQGCVDRAAVVAAGQRHVRVRVESEVVGFLEVVLESLRIDDAAVVPLQLGLCIKTVTERRSADSFVVNRCIKVEDLALLALDPHVIVMGIPY